MSWHSEEERKRRQMGSPVWPLKPGPFEWENGQRSDPRPTPIREPIKMEETDKLDALLNFILDDRSPVTAEDLADVELFDAAIAKAKAEHLARLANPSPSKDNMT